MIKLIALFIVILIIAVIGSTVTPEYEKCYSDMEYSSIAAMGCCEGKINSIGDLSETCTDCPYLVSLYDKEE